MLVRHDHEFAASDPSVKKNMSLESQLCDEADEEVQMAHAMKGDIAQRLHAATEASSSNSEYDVFLSFRGLDTRKKFTDHLYKALTDEGYRTFRDDNGIERGENIKSELQKAIKKSRMSVMVLSKNYANSTACLFELQTILEHKKTSDHKILPVFYDVDPSEIKEQAEKLDFKKTTIEQVKEWSSSFKEVAIEQVKAWSAALKEVASMAGIVSQNQSNGYEATLIKGILDCIHNKIDHDFPRVQDIKRPKNRILCESISTGVRTSQLRKESLSILPGYHISLGRLWRRLDGLEEYLLAQAKDVRRKLRSEMLQIWKTPKKEVEVWLRDVESWKGGVQRLHQEVFRESRVHSRVQLRIIEEKIQEKIQEAAELQEKGRAFNDNLLVAFPIDRVLLMPPTNLESVEARNAERIRGYLRETLRETLSVM